MTNKIDFVQAARRASEGSRLLSRESDRGCVLVGGAMLDEILSSLLRGFFVRDSGATETLLGPNGALSTFSSRINLCRALGLITEPVFRDLERIRTIRNQAAHFDRRSERGFDFSFDDVSVADRCRALASIPAEIRQGVATRVLFEIFVSMVSAILAEHARIYGILADKLDRRLAVDIVLQITPSINFEQHMQRLLDDVGRQGALIEEESSEQNN